MTQVRPETVIAVVVTHRRVELLAESLAVVSGQDRPVDHLIVVDNADEPEVAELVAAQPVPTTYLGSQRNLGGAGGFALGMLHALALGADWVWCADDDGRPDGPAVLSTLLDCAKRHDLDEVSPVVANLDDPDTLAFPLRRGLVWRRKRSELFSDAGSGASGSNVADGEAQEDDLLPGIASLFNGALFSAECLEQVGVPDLRLFFRGDEVEVHRRLVRSGVKFGTCLRAGYLHPDGSAEFRPILGGRMHTQYPDNDVKRYFTYRNRGYLMSQPGMRRLLPQEYARFGWFFLVQQRDPKGFAEWVRLRGLGRRERFTRP
ncbi:MULTISPECIES: galactofuranosyltransferase GlfT1 [Gordonia]|uniref:Glycosyltransferase family 2 protein n=1 Tax=Gordonia amicalis TaxID=89053 RepID=A0AAE4R3L0_9ACTN|nr:MULTISPECIES: glycosyltransferase family 2 protein [Gordonia]ATD69109.1 galactofuranosyl transferase [Gordonia sp. 1D]KAF0967020.1 Galactofuranosyltransferase GlfT1 [Gordonia sp. YY1]MBA5847628.1 glycosyltransferase family 2 protein [Gordonia amicalis]MCZ4580786.1 glycosyltransferase family 2 protein [Gordonia amicalis]MCZ4654250.1 glycosyltransferase family 2 protein [Gordonia amicalis]